MACNERPGPQAVIKFVEMLTDERLSQRDWHDLRKAADESGYNTSRGAADDKVAAEAFDQFVNTLTAPFGGAYEKEVGKAAKKARKDFTASPVSNGTVGILSYLSEGDVEGAIERLREVREGFWDSEVEWMSGKSSEELQRRLANARESQERLKANAEDFGYLDPKRLAYFEARETAVLDAMERQLA